MFVSDQMLASTFLHVFIFVRCNADLEAMQLESQANEAAHNARILQHQMTLTNKLRELENRCEKMQEAEMQMKQRNEADRQQFEKEKQDVIPPLFLTFAPTCSVWHLLLRKSYHVLRL